MHTAMNTYKHTYTHIYTYTQTHTHTHPEDSVNNDFIFPISTIPKLFVPLDPSGCQDLQEKRIKVRNGALLIYLFIPHLAPDGILGGSLRWTIQTDNNIPKFLSRAHKVLRELPRSASPASSPAPSPCKHTSLHCCTSFIRTIHCIFSHAFESFYLLSLLPDMPFPSQFYSLNQSSSITCCKKPFLITRANSDTCLHSLIM